MAARALVARLVAALLCGLLACACLSCGSSTSQSGARTEAAAQTNPGAAASVRLLISRDFGRTIMMDQCDSVPAGTTVMNLLTRHTKIETGYGGGFVAAIDGLKSTFGRLPVGQAADWFYWVDGRLANVGADYWTLNGDETVWWDYHPWTGTAMIPGTISALPRPFHEIELAWYSPSALESEVRTWASRCNLRLGPVLSTDQVPDRPALLVLPLASTQMPAWLGKILDLQVAAGVFVQVDGDQLVSLSENGTPVDSLDAAAFAIAHPENADQLVLILLGKNESAVSQLMQVLSAETARAKIGLGLRNGQIIILPEMIQNASNKEAATSATF